MGTPNTTVIRRQLHRPGYSTFDVVDVEWTHAISPVLMSGLSDYSDAVRWAEDHGYVVDHVRSNIGSPWCGGGAWRSIYAPRTIPYRPRATI
jgi:hypothetical protein